MNRKDIETHFGSEWVDFMAPFVESSEMNTILAELRKQTQEGKVIAPAGLGVFRAFRETPLSQVRVIIVGQDPYSIRGYATGIPFGVDNAELNTPQSLVKIIDAVEVDAYGGLNFNKPDFDRSLVSWCKQGVLMLNAALTVPEGPPVDMAGQHLALWKPFVSYVISKIQVIKRTSIFIAWGSDARDILSNVDTFMNIMPANCVHPSYAARQKAPWECRHFSIINSIIIANKLGDPIKW